MEKYENETIAAIATALSDSGIGIVRISGDNAIYIVDNVFRSASGKRILKKVQSHTIHYGYIVDQNENVIDEVMAAVMKAPKSYTMEDTVEIPSLISLPLSAVASSFWISFSKRLTFPANCSGYPSRLMCSGSSNADSIKAI